MISPEYLVARNESIPERPVVGVFFDNFLPLNARAGRIKIVRRVDRRDLIIELISRHDETIFDWAYLKNIPDDLASALFKGRSIQLMDLADKHKEHSQKEHALWVIRASLSVAEAISKKSSHIGAGAGAF